MEQNQKRWNKTSKDGAKLEGWNKTTEKRFNTFFLKSYSGGQGKVVNKNMGEGGYAVWDSK